MAYTPGVGGQGNNAGVVASLEGGAMQRNKVADAAPATKLHSSRRRGEGPMGWGMPGLPPQLRELLPQLRKELMKLRGQLSDATASAESTAQGPAEEVGGLKERVEELEEELHQMQAPGTHSLLPPLAKCLTEGAVQPD